MSGPSDLRTTLAELRSRIGRTSDRRLNEQNTKATLIEPLLRALGWVTEDLEQVQREYKIKRSDKPVDYALLTVRTPRLFLEAKALGENLLDRRWASQMMGYAAVAGVEWIVLTDGDEYRIYNAHATVPVDEKLFRSVRVTETGPLVEETLGLLAKHRIEENRIEVLWRAQFVDRKVKAGIEQLFSADSDMVLVNYLAKNTTNLSAPEIRSSLARCKLQFDFPVPLDADLVVDETKRKRGTRTRGTLLETQRVNSDVTLAQLIEAKILRPPLELHCRYKGTDLRARIEADGTVSTGGERHPSLSAAGGAARALVIGKREDGSTHPTNGWKFWRFRDASGAELHVDVLRERFVSDRDGGSSSESAAS